MTSLYTLIAVISVCTGSCRPASVVVPGLSYQECSNQINTLKQGDSIVVNSASCAIQPDK